MKRVTCIFVLAALAGLAAANAVAGPGTVTRDSDLRSGPALDAAISGRVANRAKVDILSTKGGWIEVETADGKSGWLRLMNVQPASGGSSGSALKGLATAGNVARTGATGSTAATGVKGISKEDLAGAKPNFNEVNQLDHYRASPAEGQQYARSVGLKAQHVDPLPANPQ